MLNVWEIITSRQRVFTEDLLQNTLYRKMRGESGGGGEYDITITSTPPLYLPYSLGHNLSDWSITGQTVQDGEPTPENPVDVQGVGEKTKNLFDKNNVNVLDAYINTSNSTLISSSVAKTIYISCKSNATYTISKKKSLRFFIAYTTETPQVNVNIYNAQVNNNATELTITTGSDAEYLCAFIYHQTYDALTFDEIIGSLQIEENSTATAYEPYGYKIPVVTRGKNLFSPAQEYTIGKYKYFKFTEKDETYNLTVQLKEGKTPPTNLYFGFTEFGDYTSPQSTKWVVKNGHIVDSKNVDNFILNLKLKYISIYPNKIDINEYFDIQLELGSTATAYEPYTEPTTTNIYLDSPLMTGETVSSDGTVRRADGTIETIAPPNIPTATGTCVLDVDTSVQPSSVTVTYKSSVPDNDMADMIQLLSEI